METRRCLTCGASKPLSAFGPRQSRCRPCRSVAQVTWQQLNRDKYRKQQNRWCAANRDKTKVYAHRAYLKMSDEAKHRKAAAAKIAHLKRTYSLTPDDWQALHDRQGGLCALCKIPGRVGKHGKLHVDHDHETGRVRGLLCGACNVALGVLGDTSRRIEAVLAYLAKV